MLSAVGASLALAFTLACSAADEDATGLRVVATTTQIGDFVQAVAGDRVRLTVLLRPNQDAHDFAAAPSQIRALSDADLVLRNGLGLDAFVDKAIKRSGGEVVSVSEGIERRAARDGDDGAAAGDPHVWFAVANARVMVENVSAALREADPENAAFYEERAGRYQTRLDQLDAWIRSQVGEIASACRKLVTNHDVFGYYAEAYAFEILGSIVPGLSTQAQPAAGDIAAIVELIQAEGVPAIFAEASANAALLRQVGREAGVIVVDDLYGDSLGPPGSDGESYVAMMESNTLKIVAALKDCGT